MCIKDINLIIEYLYSHYKLLTRVVYATGGRLSNSEIALSYPHMYWEAENNIKVHVY